MDKLFCIALGTDVYRAEELHFSPKCLSALRQGNHANSISNGSSDGAVRAFTRGLKLGKTSRHIHMFSIIVCPLLTSANYRCCGGTFSKEQLSCVDESHLFANEIRHS